MVEDKDQITLDESSLQETTQVSAKIQYQFSRFSLNGHTDHRAYVLYGSEHNQGAELAEVHYTDGGFESVTIKYGTKESLLAEYNRIKSRKRGFRFGGPGHLPFYPSHDAIRIVASGDEFNVYDDESRHLGKQVGKIKAGERFTHGEIPYDIEVSNLDGQTEFKRIDPNGNSTWEFTIPNDAPITGPEEILVNFKA